LDELVNCGGDKFRGDVEPTGGGGAEPTGGGGAELEEGLANIDSDSGTSGGKLLDHDCDCDTPPDCDCDTPPDDDCDTPPETPKSSSESDSRK